MPMPSPKTALKRALGSAARRLEKPWQPDPALWNLHAGDQGLALQGIALDEMAERHGTPIHVVDFARVEDNIRGLLDARSPAGRPARVLYSYKTNPVPGVLEKLHALGAGAEVVSPFELWLALRLGVAGAAIVYNGAVKSRESLETAIAADIACINANSLGDLQRIGDAARACDRTANVGLRIALAGGWAGQFGMRAQTAELAQAVAHARDHAHLRLIGLHAHRGAWMRSEAEVRAHVGALMAERDRLQTEHGVVLPLVNVGGSLACQTTAGINARAQRMNRSLLVDLPAPPADSLSPANYARVVLETVAECCNDESVPEVVLEPGRGVTGNTQMLLTTVIDLRPDPDGFTYAILDAGIHNAESMRNEQHAVLALNPRRDAREQRYRLTGPLCTPGDVLRYSVRLPKLEVGDRLALMDAGAYFLAFSSPFSFPRPGVVAIENGWERLLRTPECFADIIARDRLPQGPE